MEEKSKKKKGRIKPSKKEGCNQEKQPNNSLLPNPQNKKDVRTAY